MISPQYTYDNEGHKIGVFLPIDDWNELEQIPGVLEISRPENITVPDWQIELGKKKLERIANGSAGLMPWEEAKESFKL